jgi:hypothetical protein
MVFFCRETTEIADGNFHDQRGSCLGNDDGPVRSQRGSDGGDGGSSSRDVLKLGVERAGEVGSVQCQWDKLGGPADGLPRETTSIFARFGSFA